MHNSEIIFKYFPNLSPEQKLQFQKLEEIYTFWNEQINVISRKDMDSFYERHVLHSLGIAKILTFRPGTKVLDVGTGGGFPGIPLAILYPECNFVLVDTIGKKIKVVDEAVTALGLKNVTTHHQRAEKLKEKFDFVVSRAVTKMPLFLTWVRNKIKEKQINALPNGILYLKGGDLREEMRPVKDYHEYNDLSDFFKEEFFETKKVVYVQL